MLHQEHNLIMFFFRFRGFVVCYVIHKLRCQTEASMSRPSQTFVRSCPDFRAFNRFSCVHVQIFARSPDFRAFNQFSYVYVQNFERSTDFRAFMTRFLCVSPYLFAFTRFSCVLVETFERSTDFRAFMFIHSCVNQTRVR